MSEHMPEPTPDKATVLVVDDDQVLRRQLFWALDSEHTVVEADSRESAIAQIEGGRIQVVLSDLHLPPDLDGISGGLAIIEAARSARPSIPVIVITGSNSRQIALEAIGAGAYGFFEKPFNEAEVAHIVRQAARVRHLEEENLKLRASLGSFYGFGRLLGSSPALERIMQQARAVADTSATVLLSGENGTGKEMLARAIHEESPRADQPFIAVSCAALPESLIESELFGHERGAFTGATQAKKGRFELADGGTLFLDEIGELNQAVQVKLLRVLQERAFERLGSTKTLTVDIRLIAASNRDLDQEVEEKRFRGDLFYRLNVVPLKLPPLRERREDLPILAAHFAAKAAEKHRRPHASLDPALIEAIQEYDWPGNVRELENLMERLVVLTTGTRLGTEFLPEKMLHLRPAAAIHQAATANGEDAYEATLEGAMLALKRRLVTSALQAEGGNKVAAAKRLAISRSYLHRLISELEITT
ncbi:MAG TPA: sigma-54 dependent transcriptional regulator [Pyrinomonadaceae bacterium]|nr:sigma-54 dependent transcriptional regulator [Pyrinomonadaceae bacterium]